MWIKSRKDHCESRETCWRNTDVQEHIVTDLLMEYFPTGFHFALLFCEVWARKVSLFSKNLVKIRNLKIVQHWTSNPHLQKIGADFPLESGKNYKRFLSRVHKPCRFTFSVCFGLGCWDNVFGLWLQEATLAFSHALLQRFTAVLLTLDGREFNLIQFWTWMVKQDNRRPALILCRELINNGMCLFQLRSFVFWTAVSESTHLSGI